MKPGPQLLKIEARLNGWRKGEYTITADPAVPGELRQHLLTAMWQLKGHREDQIHEWSLWVEPMDKSWDKFEFIVGMPAS